MKHVNKCKRKGIKVLLALGEKTLQKEWRKMTKKFWLKPWPSRIERESFENFLKSKFEHMKIIFEKLFIRFLIDRKLGSIDRKCFNWTSINRASIKTDRGWPKFLIAISIYRKTGSIDRNSRKIFFLKKQTSFMQKLLKVLNFKNKKHEYEMKCFSKIQVLNPVFPKFKIYNPFS